MKTLVHWARSRKETGLTTAEYAVGTIGACTIGGVLAEVGKSDWFGGLIQQLISNIPNILKLPGLM